MDIVTQRVIARLSAEKEQLIMEVERAAAIIKEMKETWTPPPQENAVEMVTQEDEGKPAKAVPYKAGKR